MMYFYKLTLAEIFDLTKHQFEFLEEQCQFVHQTFNPKPDTSVRKIL